MHGFKWTYRQEETFVLDFEGGRKGSILTVCTN